MTPRVDPPGTTQFCPTCEHNAPKFERALSCLRMVPQKLLLVNYPEFVDELRNVLKEWQPEKRGGE